MPPPAPSGTPVRSATRITAERARGLAAASAAPGLDARQRVQAVRRLGRERRAAVDLGPALARDEGLDDPVLERMEADDDEAAARREQRERRVQGLLELLKLGVDENPKRLKRARCRVLARLAGPHRTSHDVGKLACGSYRAPAFAPSNKRLCNL